MNGIKLPLLLDELPILYKKEEENTVDIELQYLPLPLDVSELSRYQPLQLPPKLMRHVISHLK